jgi:hypothetical protein
VFTYTKALQQQDAAQFDQAMRKEIEDHESQDHWDIVPRSSIPEGKKTIKLSGVSSASVSLTDP